MGDRAKDLLADASQILSERGRQYGDAGLLFSNMAVRFGLVLGIYVFISILLWLHCAVILVIQ